MHDVFLVHCGITAGRDLAATPHGGQASATNVARGHAQHNACNKWVGSNGCAVMGPKLFHFSKIKFHFDTHFCQWINLLSMILTAGS
jgi:hypothetical protein